MGARTQNRAGKDHRADAELLGIYVPGRLAHGLRRWFISTCRNASARTEVVELMTHNAKGEVIDAYTSWEWSTLCGELSKLEVDLHAAKLIVLPVAKSETPETTAASHQVLASDFATRDQSEMISDGYRWRRWESKTSDFGADQATTGNHRKPDPDSRQGRADVGDVPTAQTLGPLARKVLSSSRHADSRRLARAVLRLLARQ